MICPSSNDETPPGATPQEKIEGLSKPGHVSYVYLGKGRRAGEGDPAEVVLAYDRPANHGSGGEAIWLLFADGHVEIVGGRKNVQPFVARLEAGHNPPRPSDAGPETKR